MSASLRDLRLVTLDPGAFDQLRVQIDFLADQGVHVGGRHDHRIDAQRGQLLSDAGLLERLERFSIELFDTSRGVETGRKIPIQNGYSAF